MGNLATFGSIKDVTPDRDKNIGLLDFPRENGQFCPTNLGFLLYCCYFYFISSFGNNFKYIMDYFVTFMDAKSKRLVSKICKNYYRKLVESSPFYTSSLVKKSYGNIQYG